MAYTILIVDDDLNQRRALAMFLSNAGYRTVAAADVPSAMHVLKEGHPDLLVTDIRLDLANGLHLIAMAPRPIPAIVITGFLDPALEEEARKLGADYLVKPVSLVVLSELIGKRLATVGAPASSAQRRSPRTAVTIPIPVRAGDRRARLLDISAGGVGLEVHGTPAQDLPDVLTLTFEESGVSIPVHVVWKRQQDEQISVCGGEVSEHAQPWLQALLQELL